jgi:tRNA-specific 2-thiouridylase
MTNSNSNIKPSCLLGMSGGTDSSVAAMLLQEQGYTVIGVTFRFWDNEQSAKHLIDAQELAKKLGLHHFVYDARKLFQTEIIDYFTEEYLAGRTPVPCVKCNNQLKWKLLFDLSKEIDCEAISTGHYSNKIERNGHFHIAKGVDPDKDQSFFLWGLPQDILQKITLPLGNYTKAQVREIANKKGFPVISKKKDSLGICFCSDDYRPFLKKQAVDFKFEKGNFVDESGEILGQHQGYPFYTVGQRRGLGIHLNRAVFVKELIPSSNTVVLAPLKSLYKKEFLLKEWNLINEDDFTDDFDIITKIRYRKQATPSRIVKQENGLLKVELAEPLESIAPGQAAAFYKDDIVLGGGIIV